MPYYFVRGFLSAPTSSYTTAAQVNATGTTKRGKVCEVNLGAISNPNATDTYVDFDISRITATGAGAYTAWTPNPIDSADGAAVNVSGVNATAEATAITASSALKRWGMNQRNSLRWVAQQESQMLVWPATSGNGLVLRAQSSTWNASLSATIDFME
jgi:hypothetical protein